MTPVRLESATPRSRMKHSSFVFNMYLIGVLTIKLSEIFLRICLCMQYYKSINMLLFYVFC